MKVFFGTLFATLLFLFLVLLSAQANQSARAKGVIGVADSSPADVVGVAAMGGAFACFVAYLFTNFYSGFKVFVVPTILSGGAACAIAASILGNRIFYRGEGNDPITAYLSGREFAMYSIAGGFAGMILLYLARGLFSTKARVSIETGFVRFIFWIVVMGLFGLFATMAETGDRTGGILGAALGIGGIGGFALLMFLIQD